MGVPPALSALWFPVKERTTATAIATILNNIGVGISFALGTSRLVQHIWQETPKNTYNLQPMHYHLLGLKIKLRALATYIKQTIHVL